MAFARQTEDQFGIPRFFIDAVKDGYYAVRPTPTAEWVFFRISRPEDGKLKGCVKIQTQHGDTLKDAFYLQPDGVFVVKNGDIKNLIITLVTKATVAAADYGKHSGNCCRCGKTLTREPWVSYGIGSECDQQWPEIREAYEEHQKELLEEGDAEGGEE